MVKSLFEAFFVYFESFLLLITFLMVLEESKGRGKIKSIS